MVDRGDVRLLKGRIFRGLPWSRPDQARRGTRSVDLLATTITDALNSLPLANAAPFTRGQTSFQSQVENSILPQETLYLGAWPA